MKKTFSFILIACGVFCIINVSAQKNVNFSTELIRLSDISLLPGYMEGSKVIQESSYDRTGGNDDGFSGKYSYLRKETKGLVLLDVKGAGVIERIWTPTPTDDTLDFYFDGANAPSYSIRFRDLFTGNIFPFLKPLVAYHFVGGYYSYVPIPFSNGCKIIFRGEKIMFHQIQYRQYDNRYNVKTFNSKLSVSEEKLLYGVANLWNNPEKRIENFSRDYKVLEIKNDVSPETSTPIAEINGGGRIVGIELIPSQLFEGVLKQIDLKITWENNKLPAVYVPVADFFGYAFGKIGMESLIIGATPAKAYCYFPMPFDAKAKVELVYRGNKNTDRPINITSRIFYNNQKRIIGKEGRFYAYWNREHPAIGKSHVFLNGTGKGHYVATILQSQATEYTNFTEFFEGDDKTIVDGEMTMHGTGSEDYFNGGWYAQPGGWVEKRNSPVSGCMNYSLPKSQTAGYRLFISDKIPFNKSIEHTIEHGPVNNREVDYVSVAMYYADRIVAENKAPENHTSKVYEPSTYSFYTRLMKHLSCNGGLEFKNDQAELTGNSNAVLNINVNEIPKGKYKLYLHKTDAGNKPVEVKMAHEKGVSDWILLPKAKNGDDVFVGTVEVGDFYVPVSVLFRSNVDNPGLRFDRVMLVK